MPSKQLMKTQSSKHSGYINKRGNVPKSLKPEQEGYAVGPYLLALFIFVVVGSGEFVFM